MRSEWLADGKNTNLEAARFALPDGTERNVDGLAAEHWEHVSSRALPSAEFLNEDKTVFVAHTLTISDARPTGAPDAAGSRSHRIWLAREL